MAPKPNPILTTRGGDASLGFAELSGAGASAELLSADVGASNPSLCCE